MCSWVGSGQAQARHNKNIFAHGVKIDARARLFGLDMLPLPIHLTGAACPQTLRAYFIFTVSS